MADAPIEERPTEDQNTQSQGSEFHLPSFLNSDIVNQFFDSIIKNSEAKRRYYEEKALYFQKENELLQYEIDQLNENDGPVFIDHGEKN